MKAIKAITLSLGDTKKPIISKYELSIIVHKLFLSKIYNGESINIQKERAGTTEVNKYLAQLISEGILSHVKNINNVYALLGRMDANAEDIACAIDPFCYVSHLSAMAYHGLTDRLPAKLILSSPSDKDWKIHARERMHQDLGDEYDSYCSNGLIRLVRTKMEKINKTEILCLRSSHLGAYKNVRDRTVRVSTIGRTFLDMLRHPEHCGGINHVLDVYEMYCKKYLRLITDDIDKHGNGIEKVRAGYIIDELLGIKNEVVEGWTAFAQRGGSRKLDPSSEYIPKWSDKWMLSTNVIRSNVE